MSQVFISYRRYSGGIYARSIYDNLKEKGIDTFYDRESLHKFTGVYDAELQRNISQCQDFLLLITDSCLEEGSDIGDVYQDEILQAKRENKRIIPIICGNFEFKDNLESDFTFLKSLESLELRDFELFESKFIPDLLDKLTETDSVNKAKGNFNSLTTLEDRYSIERRYSLYDRLLTSKVKKIDLCAVLGIGFFTNRGIVEPLLEDGCVIRFVMSNPNSAEAKKFRKYFIPHGSDKMKRSTADQVFESVLEWKRMYPDQIFFKQTDIMLPFAIFAVHKENEEESTIKVDYYGFETPDKTRRSVFIQHNDRDNFNYYKDQYDWLWENSDSVNLDSRYSKNKGLRNLLNFVRKDD